MTHLCHSVTFPSTFITEASFILSPCPLPKVCSSLEGSIHFILIFPSLPALLLFTVCFPSSCFPPSTEGGCGLPGPSQPLGAPKGPAPPGCDLRGLLLPGCSGMAPRFVARCKYSPARGKAGSGPQPGAGHGSAAKYSSGFAYSTVTQ